MTIRWRSYHLKRGMCRGKRPDCALMIGKILFKNHRLPTWRVERPHGLSFRKMSGDRMAFQGRLVQLILTSGDFHRDGNYSTASRAP